MKQVLCTIILFLFSLSIFVVDAAADEALDALKAAKREFRNERYLEASRLFRKAYELKPSWKIYYNIGQAEAAAKRYGPALEAFELYIAEGGDEVSLNRQDEVRAEVDRLRDIVGILNVKTQDGARISVDGMVRGTAPVYGGIPVSAGVEHVVTVEFNGGAVSEETVRVLGGRTAELTIPGREADAAPDGPLPEGAASHVEETNGVERGREVESTDSSRSKKRAAGISAVAVGASLVVGGVAAGGVALAKHSDLVENCTDGVCPAGFVDTERMRNTLGITSAALLGVGAAVVAVGAVLLVKSKTGEDHVAAYPIIGPEIAGAGLTVAF